MGTFLQPGKTILAQGKAAMRGPPTASPPVISCFLQQEGRQTTHHSNEKWVPSLVVASW